MINPLNRKQIGRRPLWQSGKLGADWARHTLATKVFEDKGFSLMIGLAAIYAFLDVIFFVLYQPASDWAPLWVGGQLSWSSAALAYDADLVTTLQAPLVIILGDRPFVYPPSALLLFAPLSALPFKLSYLFFVALSIWLFVRAARPLAPRTILMLLAPPLVFAAIAGQPTILVAALIMFGLTQLDRNELRAGVLIAIAAMIKPTLLLLAPIALAGGGYWRAFAAAAATAALIGVITIPVFGIDAWHAWLAALPAFKTLITESQPLLFNAVTPYAMAVRLDVPPLPISALAALIAVPVVWFSFARTQHTAIRIVSMVGGALLISPYAMNYELAAFAPVVAAWRLDHVRHIRIPAFWAASLIVTLSVAGLIAIYVWAVVSLASIWRDKPQPSEAAIEA